MDAKDLKNQFSDSLGSVKGLFTKSSLAPEVHSGVLGIDIGTDSVKVCELDALKDVFLVRHYAIQKIDGKNYRDALSRALSGAGVSLEGVCVLSVSGQGAVSRYVELPMMNKSELESSMRFEIEKYVPFPVAEVVTDYAIAGEFKGKAKMNVLIAAAKNDLVQKKHAIAKEMNLKVKALDLDSLALANFYTEIAGKPKDDACAAIINMGKSCCNMNIVVGSQPFLSRDIFVGGDDFSKKIADGLELETAEAEKLKCAPQGREEELATVCDSVLNNLASEIRVSLDYFESRGNRAVDAVFLTGGTSRLVGLREYLEHALAVDVKILDYAGRLKLAEGIDAQAFRRDSDLLAVAMGLALRNTA